MNSNSHSASVNIFDQIDAVCREFRKRWKQGPRLTIEEALVRVGEKARPNLLGNLLDDRFTSSPPVSGQTYRDFP